MRINSILTATCLLVSNLSYATSLIYSGPECETGNIVESRMEVVEVSGEAAVLRITGSAPVFYSESDYGCLSTDYFGQTKETGMPVSNNQDIIAVATFYGDILTIVFQTWELILDTNSSTLILSGGSINAVTYTMRYDGGNGLTLLHQIRSLAASVMTHSKSFVFHDLIATSGQPHLRRPVSTINYILVED